MWCMGEFLKGIIFYDYQIVYTILLYIHYRTGTIVVVVFVCIFFCLDIIFSLFLQFSHILHILFSMNYCII